MTELDPEGRRLWARLAELQDTISTAQAEERHVKELLRKVLAPGTHTVDGDPVVKLSPARTFDAAAAVKALPAEVAQTCFHYVMDPKAVRARFSPADAEQYMVEGTTRVALT